MDFDAYARTGVDLVNAPLESLDDLRALVGVEAGWPGEAITERDMTTFRRAQKRLRDVFELGASGRAVEAVTELNSLLETYPVQPRISSHDGADWHMHVTSRGASVGSEYLAGAVWGLAVWLCEYGSSRFGVCADDRCGNVYLDTSSNCCRRFCSERCATRSHVAAHRARKRAAGADRPGAGAPGQRITAPAGTTPVQPAPTQPTSSQPRPVEALPVEKLPAKATVETSLTAVR